MAECEAISPLTEDYCCRAGAWQLYTLGCVHEHVVRHYLCAEHAASVLVCQACWLAGHPCALFRLIDLAGRS
jgi:hypothetical protein